MLAQPPPRVKPENTLERHVRPVNDKWNAPV
jgi:hypothetical protein